MFVPKIAFHPGEYIGDELKARNRTQSDFANLIWVSRQFVNDLIKWRKNITPRLAILISAAFWSSADFWLWMQEMYDLYQTEKENEIIKKTENIKIKVKELELTYA